MVGLLKLTPFTLNCRTAYLSILRLRIIYQVLNT